MKKIISFILAAAMMLTILPSAVLASAEDDAITVQAVDYISLYDDGSVFPPAKTDTTLQIWEKSAVEYVVEAPKAATYEMQLKAAIATEYSSDTFINLYFNDGLINENIKMIGNGGDGEYTDSSFNNLGFVDLNEGINYIKIEVPNSYGARTVIMDYMTFTAAPLIETPAKIEAEDFGSYTYTDPVKSTPRTVFDIDDIDGQDRLTNGTNPAGAQFNAIMVRGGAYTSFNLAVAEEGYYKICYNAAVQGPEGGWCDNRLVPNIRINGEDVFDPATSYTKKIHTLRAVGADTPTSAFGGYKDNSQETIYLKKGGNNIILGFANGYNSAYCNQPFQFDYFTLNYIGPEPDPDDKPNIQDLSEENPTELNLALYDFNESVPALKPGDTTTFKDQNGKYVLRKGSKLVYNLRAPQDGTYKVIGNMALAANDTTIGIVTNGGGKADTPVVSTCSDWGLLTYLDEKWGVVDLHAGVNTIAISTGSDMYFNGITLENAGAEVADPVWSPVQVDANTAIEKYVDLTYSQEHPGGDGRPGSLSSDGYEYGGGSTVVMRRRDWYTYEFDVPEEGNYNFSVNCALGDRANAPVFYALNGGKNQTGFYIYNTNMDWGDYQDQNIAVLHLNKGINTITYGVDSQTTNFGHYVNYLRFAKIDTFELLGVRANSRLVENEENVFRGTDTIKLTFNGYCDENTINSSTIKLIKMDGTVVETIPEIDKNVINLKLLDSLEYDEYYKIFVSGTVASVFNVALNSDIEIEFKTAAEGEQDSGNDVISEQNMVIDYEDVTISGQVVSSNAYPMSGRKVFATLLYPNGETVVEDIPGVTGENGIFTIKYELQANSPEGEYTAIVSEEYAEHSAASTALYFASNTENEFLSALKNAASSNEVAQILASYESRLGYNLINDLSKVPDKDMFYQDFVGCDYKKMPEFKTDYDLFRTVEAIRPLIDNTKMEPALYNEENASVLGIRVEDINYIVNLRNDFVAEVIRCRQIRDPHAYAEKVRSLANDYLAKEFDIDVPEFAAKSAKVTLGQGISLPIGFDETQNKVVSVTIKAQDITQRTTIDLLKNATIKVVNGAEKSFNDGVLTVTFNPDEPVDIKTLGNISITAKESCVNDIQFTGSVTYQVADGSFTTLNVEDKTITITATSTGGSGGGGGASSGGTAPSGGSSVSPTVSPTVQPSEEPQEEEYRFNDLAGFSWAADSIYYLLNDGPVPVISESPDHMFRPGDPVKREEFVKMIVSITGVYDEYAETTLADVNKDEWYAPYVASAVKAGFVTGDENGNFGVGQNLSRQDMAVILSRCLGDVLPQADMSQLFADDDQIAEYARDAVYRTKTAGIMNGVGDNMFDPYGTANRAMAAKVICESLKLL